MAHCHHSTEGQAQHRGTGTVMLYTTLDWLRATTKVVQRNGALLGWAASTGLLCEVGTRVLGGTNGLPQVKVAAQLPIHLQDQVVRGWAGRSTAEQMREDSSAGLHRPPGIRA